MRRRPPQRARRERPRALRWLALAACLACAPSSPPPPGAAQKRPIVLSTEYDDQRAGEQGKSEVAAALGLVPDPKVQELVEAVGKLFCAYCCGRDTRHCYCVHR